MKTSTALLTESKVDGLSAQLAALKGAGRGEVLVCVRAWFTAQQTRLRETFLANNDAAALILGGTQAADTLIQSLFTLASGKKSARIALVATGGYGRKELFPYSDIDILFLHDTASRQTSERIAEYILYMLWDLGLTVGQAHRDVNDTLSMARDDITVLTNLLDARIIAGDQQLFGQLKSRFEQDVLYTSPFVFVENKLAERDLRHQRFGDSRYVLEPNVKEGKGGLRDLQTLWWLARAAYPIDDVKELVKMHLLTREEYRAFDRARHFLWQVRAHLHILSGHAEERLSFDKQQAMATLMGFTHPNPNRAVERFMRRYFGIVNRVGAATRVFCALLEEGKKRKVKKSRGWLTLSPWKLGHFKRDGERLNIKTELAFEQQPALMIELFRMHQVHGMDIHPRALQLMARHLKRIGRAVQNDPRTNAIFLDILLSEKNAENTLRRMSEAGVLGRFIPEFGRVIGQTQFNMYHVYTVDEHTLVAVGILHAIENGMLKDELPVISDVARRIEMRRVLYVALFCHDIAKGRGGDHSEIGERIAMKLAKRFGFSTDEIETVAWLVKHHLLFSNTAFKRDLTDPKTIHDFLAAVQSSNRLKLLFLLTVADMRAVGSSVWNAWKASLLEELYRRTEQLINADGQPLKNQEAALLKKALLKVIPGLTPDKIEAYVEQLPSGFLVGLNPHQHAIFLRMLSQSDAMDSPILIDTQHDYERNFTEIIICTKDEHGLFSKLSGAMALAGANIIGAKICTLKNGMAIDVFQVQDAVGDVFDRPDRLAKMSVYIEQALAGELDLTQAFAERRKKYGRRVGVMHSASGHVAIENNASAIYTVVEISGQDRVGFLYQATETLAKNGFSIVTAHVSTYGTQVADVFYIKDAFGMKIEHPEKIEAIRKMLLVVVNNPERV